MERRPATVVYVHNFEANSVDPLASSELCCGSVKVEREADSECLRPARALADPRVCGFIGSGATFSRRQKFFRSQAMVAMLRKQCFRNKGEVSIELILDEERNC